MGRERFFSRVRKDHPASQPNTKFGGQKFVGDRSWH
jgi:hypothetical protein